MTGRTYQVAIEGRELRVNLRREGEQTFARLDGGPEVAVELEALHGSLHALRLDDRQVELLALRGPDTVSVAIGGHAYEVEVIDEMRARLLRVVNTASGGHARRELKAPMPGLVVKLLVEPGEAISRGQPLVVLQAMKMENELSLPHDGTIQAIHVTAGQTVEQGQLLVVVE